MKKSIKISLVLSMCISSVFASGVQQNNPTVSSLAYSGALFKNENNIKVVSNTSESAGINLSKNEKMDTNNSRLYSGAWYPEQNNVSGKSGVNYNKGNQHYENNPTVSSLAYSGAQFPQFNR